MDNACSLQLHGGASSVLRALPSKRWSHTPVHPWGATRCRHALDAPHSAGSDQSNATAGLREKVSLQMLKLLALAALAQMLKEALSHPLEGRAGDSNEQ